MYLSVMFDRFSFSLISVSFLTKSNTKIHDCALSWLYTGIIVINNVVNYAIIQIKKNVREYRRDNQEIVNPEKPAI